MGMDATPLKVLRGGGRGPRERAARAHQRIRVAMAAVSICLLPALWAAGSLFPGITAAMAVLAAALVGWLALAVMLYRFRCPACAKPVHRGPVLDLFTTSCVNCGHPLAPPKR